MHTLYHGGDYNPEQWLDRPDILKQDIALMKQARVNMITLGVFSWSTLEPAEGEVHLDWLAGIIDDLWAAGISVDLSTPSAARPAWMAEKYPEVRRVTPDRTRQLFGVRENHCYTSPMYREKVRAIDEALARRFGSHPAVRLWHLSNELNGECHCPLCQAAFRDFLRQRYGTLEALNRAWNNKFWSHEYFSWEQIESPAPHGEVTNEGLALAWRRFVSHQTIDFMKWERDCIRALVPGARFTANMMYRFRDVDYFAMARELDLVSWDNYPTWHTPGDETRRALDTALMHDLFYSLKGQPFWMMESTPTVTNWQPVSKIKRPGMQMMSGLQAVAHGSDSVLYFQWRQSRGSCEKFHGAVVDHSGRADTRSFRETCAVGQALETLAPVAGVRKPKQAALVMDWANWWALDGASGPRVAGMGYWDELLRHYRGLQEAGIAVDFLDQQGDPTPYKLVVVPMLYLLQEAFAARLRDYVAQGGTLVVSQWTGVVDENDLCYLGDAPHGLTEVLGLRREEIDPLFDSESCRCVATDAARALPAQAQGGALCEVSVLEGATPLMV
ncbi:MAG: beta-galactosidase, partial [Gemmiger sp.]